MHKEEAGSYSLYVSNVLAGNPNYAMEFLSSLG
jgi:hypothetical protein